MNIERPRQTIDGWHDRPQPVPRIPRVSPPSLSLPAAATQGASDETVLQMR